MDHQELKKVLNKMNDVTFHLDSLKPLVLKFIKEMNGLNFFESSHPFFGGGCIRDLYQDKVPKDYDIFFTNRIFEEYFKSLPDSANVTKFNEILAYKADDIDFYLSKSPLGNLNLRIKNEIENYEYLVQFIFFDIFSSREEFRNRVDFSINSNTYWEKDLIINDPIAIDTSRLIPLAGINWKVSATARARYFIEKGYFISYEDFINLAKNEYNFLLLNCFLNPNDEIPTPMKLTNFNQKANLSLWNS